MQSFFAATHNSSAHLPETATLAALPCTQAVCCFYYYSCCYCYWRSFSIDFLKNFPKWIKEDLFLVVFNVFKFR